MTLIKIFIGIVKLIYLRPKIEQAEKRNDGRSWDTLILQTGSNLHELLKAVLISLQKSSLFYVVLHQYVDSSYNRRPRNLICRLLHRVHMAGTQM